MHHLTDPNKPPPELLAQCEELTKNISGQRQKYFARPYVEAGGEYHEDVWKIKIVDDQNIVVVMHLFPAHCDWHTIHLLLAARYEHGERRYNQGKEDAVNKLCTHFKEIVR